MLNVSELTYLGHILTSEGVKPDPKPDPKKIRAITNMQFPQS